MRAADTSARQSAVDNLHQDEPVNQPAPKHGMFRPRMRGLGARPASRAPGLAADRLHRLKHVEQNAAVGLRHSRQHSRISAADTLRIEETQIHESGQTISQVRPRDLSGISYCNAQTKVYGCVCE